MTGWPAADFYKNRRVLVTGGSGFLGQNLVEALRQLGAEVRILSRSSFGDGPAPAGVSHFAGDLRNRELVAAASLDCPTIFNLAAHSGPTSSNVEPFEDLENNLTAQLTLLEACRRLDPPPTVVYPSSRLVYQPTDSLPVGEGALTGPLSLYGVHKLAAEHYHQLYRHLYGLKTVILRITNPYGRSRRSGENRYSIINWFIHLAVNGEVLPIYGDGAQLRDYIHVDDVTRAFLLAGSQAAADGQVLNVGSGTGVSFKGMAEAVIEAAGAGRTAHVPFPPDAARVETGSFVADVSRIGQLLDWRPAIAFKDGLRDVVRQYRQMERIEGGRP